MQSLTHTLFKLAGDRPRVAAVLFLVENENCASAKAIADHVALQLSVHPGWGAATDKTKERVVDGDGTTFAGMFLKERNVPDVS